MPKAAINEHSNFQLIEYEIRTTIDIFRIDPPAMYT